MSGVQKAPLLRRLGAVAVGFRYGFFIGLSLLKDSLLKGPWNVFTTKDRPSTPKVLNDSSLGTHGYLKLENVKLHYVAKGPENAPLMLFLHGFPEFWYSWRHQITHFSKSYRTVAIDMRGYNDSDKPVGVKEYHITKLVSDVKETIHALGYKRCILVSHDWGGLVAWALAHFHPDLIERLIVMNGPHPIPFGKLVQKSKEQFRKSWYVFFFQLPWLPEIFLRSKDYQFLDFAFKDKKYRGSAKTSSAEDDMEAYKHAISKPGAQTSTINYYRSMMQYVAPRFPSKNITVPTLIIWGTGDKAISTEIAELSGRLVSNCKLHYIEGASHWVPQECPDEVNQGIDQFLSLKDIPKGLSKL